MQKLNKIKELIYKSDQGFLSDYFEELDKINVVYCNYLFKKKFLNFKEISKINKACKSLKRNKYKNLIKKFYKRGYYFEYENYLKKKTNSEIAGKIHIGRSRNDLDATIAKLILKKNLKSIFNKEIKIINLIDRKFGKDETLFPFYTQNQFASFLSVKHYFNSNNLSLINFLNKTISNTSFINECPIGACGLNGSSVDIDYLNIAKKIGFKTIQKNSHRSVTEYEYYLSYINDFIITIIKYSRILQDFQILHNENNKIIKFKKNFYGKSSFFPHKENIYLVEYALSLTNDLCNYSNHLTNCLRKSINSNSFEIKSTIKIGHKFFSEYNEFLDLMFFIIENLEFNKIDIYNTKYEKLFLTYLQNYIISSKKIFNIRKVNDQMHSMFKKNTSFDRIFKFYQKEGKIFNSKDLKKVKIKLLKTNKFGFGSQDSKSTNSKDIKSKIKSLTKKINNFNY